MKKRAIYTVVVVVLCAMIAISGCSTKGPAEQAEAPAPDNNSSAPASESVVAEAPASEAPASEAPASPATEAPASPSSVENSNPDLDGIDLTGKTPDGKQIVIGYNAFGDTSDFSKELTKGLISRAEAAGMKVLRADTGGDASTAIKNVDSFLTQGANVIIDVSWDLSACEAVAQKCKENSIPCIISDIPVETEGTYYMGVDNDGVGLTTGHSAAKYIKEKWGGQLDFLVLTYVEAWGDGVRPRVAKVVDALREDGIDIPDDKIIYIDPQTSDSTVVCKQKGTDFLTAHPDAKHILFVGCNEGSAQGLLAAVETSNRVSDSLIVSVDLTDMGISNLYKDDNCWMGSTAFFPENYGAVLVPMVQAVIDGKKINLIQPAQIKFVDRTNIKDFYPNPNK